MIREDVVEAALNYVFLSLEPRFACLVHIYESFETVEIDFGLGTEPVRLLRAQIATPGMAIEVPGRPEKLHVQLLRAHAVGTQGPLLMWLNEKRLLAFLEEDDGSKAQLVVMSALAAFRKPDGKLDDDKVRADTEKSLELAQRIQTGFRPGEAE